MGCAAVNSFGFVHSHSSGYRTTDPFSPAQQPLTYNAHVLTIAAILFLIAAVLLITAAIIMFPPSSIAFSAAFAGTGIATGLTITLGGPVGASAAATAAAIVSTGAAAYTYDQAQQQEPDRYQPDQNTNRNTTNDTAQQTKTDDTAANDYNTAQSSREGATRGEAHGDGGRRLAKIEERIAAAEAELAELRRTQGSSKRKKALEKQIRNLRRAAERAAKGETHGRGPRGQQN